jgi:predicted enzyme related to lactoylglutathione lyase
VRTTRRIAIYCVTGLLTVCTPASAQSEFANLIDHLHLAAPDQPKAVEWYRKYFGGEPMSEGTDRLMLGQTRLVFQKSETPQASAGSVLDHIGFSVADLDATMRQLAQGGVKITTPARDVPGLFKLASRSSRTRRRSACIMCISEVPTLQRRSRGTGTSSAGRSTSLRVNLTAFSMAECGFSRSAGTQSRAPVTPSTTSVFAPSASTKRSRGSRPAT